KKQTKAEAGKKVDATKVEADGGVLWWGQESLPDVAWFREQIKSAQGGRAPRVLDPFAGGGGLPLWAMRFGCGVGGNHFNPSRRVCSEMHPRLSATTRGPDTTIAAACDRRS